MVFNSFLFLWGFLPITFFIYRIVSDKYKNIFLLLMSLLFYAWGEPIYILLMVFSIMMNYWSGILISKADDKKKKRYLIGCIVCNLLMLGYFKCFSTFANFFGTYMGKNMLLDNFKSIALPLGISFYTFQELSYIIDLYWGKVKVKNKLLDFALYVSFFPQLVAGPIVKYKDIEQQINGRKIGALQTSIGIKRFIYGLSKKVLIANSIGEIVNKIFEIPSLDLGAKWIWGGVFLYTLQIYYDFSGYSDMAIGLGKMFGFRFIENFNYPYTAKSVQEFWRRWHISMSTWFKEYVYIPLGGNKRGEKRTYLNLLIVFAVTGIWHGAPLNFLLWGLYHGIFLLLERGFLNKILQKNKFKFINHIYTLLIVSVGWAIFRSDSLVEALKTIYRMFVWQSSNVCRWYDFFTVRKIIIVLVAVLLVGFIQERWKKWKNILYDENKIYVHEVVIQSILLILCIIVLGSGGYNPFIYFRF